VRSFLRIKRAFADGTEHQSASQPHFAYGGMSALHPKATDYCAAAKRRFVPRMDIFAPQKNVRI
jgi:hypothetical protein